MSDIDRRGHGPDGESDAAIDALVRAAAAADADQDPAETIRATRRRIAERRAPLDWLAALWRPEAAIAGYAALLVAAGLGGYAATDVVGVDEGALLIGLATGDAAGIGFIDALEASPLDVRS